MAVHPFKCALCVAWQAIALRPQGFFGRGADAARLMLVAMSLTHGARGAGHLAERLGGSESQRSKAHGSGHIFQKCWSIQCTDKACINQRCGFPSACNCVATARRVYT